ncbi:MAG: TetR family transcriptional regulator [Tepidisphaeraceae bacterium]
MTNARPRRDHHLTRQELLDNAMRIVDEEGLAALTMRHLADAVGLEPMSLYHHVPNKEALLDLMVRQIRSEVRLPDPIPSDWGELLVAVLGAYRRALCAHPNMLPLATRAGDGPPIGTQFMMENGLTPVDAAELYQALIAFTVGFAMLSARSSQMDQTAFDGTGAEWSDETCDRTLRSIIDGYRKATPTP